MVCVVSFCFVGWGERVGVVRRAGGIAGARVGCRLLDDIVVAVVGGWV